MEVIKFPAVLTTFKIVAYGNFVMDLPLTTVNTVIISSLREAAGQEKLEQDDDELDGMGSEGVYPLMMFHVHGPTKNVEVNMRGLFRGFRSTVAMYTIYSS